MFLQYNVLRNEMEMQHRKATAKVPSEALSNLRETLIK